MVCERRASPGECLALRVGLVAFLLPACAPSNQCLQTRWGYAVAHGLEYPTTPTETTPAGTPFDASGQSVSGALIDRLTTEVGECLKVSIDPRSFVVKVPADWTASCDGSQQVLSAIAPGYGCDVKGLTGSCPCRWRALVQCPNVIVATPSFYLYKDALVRFVTGSVNPWADPELAKCAAPSATPLSIGGT